MNVISDSLRTAKQRSYTICVLLLALLWNQIAFQGARIVCDLLSFFRGVPLWRYQDFTSSIDLAIPVLPWTIIIYIGTFLFWAVCLFFGSLQPREKSDRLFCAGFISKVISFVFFVVLPTTYVRPEIQGSGLFDFALRLIYRIDRGDNLFPSIHCSASWLCWVWMRGRKEIPLKYRLAAFVCAVLICISTLTTKQHVFVDTISGIAVAEANWFFAGLEPLRAWYGRFVDGLIAWAGGTWKPRRNDLQKSPRGAEPLEDDGESHSSSPESNKFV